MKLTLALCLIVSLVFVAVDAQRRAWCSRWRECNEGECCGGFGRFRTCRLPGNEGERCRWFRRSCPCAEGLVCGRKRCVTAQSTTTVESSTALQTTTTTINSLTTTATAPSDSTDDDVV